jgi:tetratricopeptide (TPR) repeat protein
LLVQRCHVGKAWALIGLGDHQRAKGLINRLKRNDATVYQGLLGEAVIENRQNRPEKAIELFKQAQGKKSADPTAYRMAAEVAAETGILPPEDVVAFAQDACDRDESNDFRNQLALATAHHLADHHKARDVALKTAFRFAHDDAKPIVRDAAIRFEAGADAAE